MAAEVRFGLISALVFLGILIWDQSHWWLSREEYNFGLFVPLFVGWVLFERSHAMRQFLATGSIDAEAPKGKGGGFLPALLEIGAWGGILIAMLFYGVGALLRSDQGGPTLPTTQAWSWSFALFLLCSAYIVSASGGKEMPPLRERLRFVALFVFPALVWLISAPLLDFAERRLSLFLLNRVTDVVFFTFEMLNFPLERRGNVLVLPLGQVGVEDACSGIRSLTACLFAGSFMAAMYAKRLWKKLTLIVLSMVLAFVMNLFRSLFLTAWAYAYGSDAIEGSFHDLTGYAVLAMTWIGLIILVQIMNYSPEIDWVEMEEEPS